MENMKIEHWKPQTKYMEFSMQYYNMFGACDGNEGMPENLQCCDTHKGENKLFINLLEKYCETLIKY